MSIAHKMRTSATSATLPPPKLAAVPLDVLTIGAAPRAAAVPLDVLTTGSVPRSAATALDVLRSN